MALVCNNCRLFAQAESPSPNVVVFLADDQGWGDLSCNGNTQVATPNIDSIGKRGATLDRFFVCPVCSPTRAEFLTGRYAMRCGVRGVSEGLERLNLDEKTIANSLQAAGYKTGVFGKWHNGTQWPYHPLARGFDEHYGFTSGHWGEYFDAPLEHNGQPVNSSGFIADAFTDHAIDFIERNRKQPFFCFVSFNTPHSPFCAPKQDWERFRDKPITQRGNAGDKESIDVTRAVLAMTENIDRNVGNVLTKLQQLGVAENTIVIYFSDNGPNSNRWNDGMKGQKGTTDEGGVRSPCFIQWPDQIPAGHRLNNVVGAIDLLPTLCGLTGIRHVGNKPLDGIDFSKLLLGQNTVVPDRVLISHWANSVSARNGGFRLDTKGALFDMRTDPSQTKDAASRYPDETKQLSAAVKMFRHELNASVTDPRDFPVGYREFPRTWLPARDGVGHGNIKRSAPAPNCSYFVNWISTEDRITWDLRVETAGQYQVNMDYTCVETDVGSLVELSAGDAKLTSTVSQAWNPPLITDQDVIPRPAAESILKKFRTKDFGTMELKAGTTQLSVRALSIPGKEVMHLRGISLILLPEARD